MLLSSGEIPWHSGGGCAEMLGSTNVASVNVGSAARISIPMVAAVSAFRHVAKHV